MVSSSTPPEVDRGADMPEGGLPADGRGRPFGDEFMCFLGFRSGCGAQRRRGHDSRGRLGEARNLDPVDLKHGHGIGRRAAVADIGAGVTADRLGRLGKRPGPHRDVGGGLAGVGRQYLAADLVVIPVARLVPSGASWPPCAAWS
ncbi:hypothetical protein GCM10029992_21630 [Glycomyces albus]